MTFIGRVVGQAVVMMVMVRTVMVRRWTRRVMMREIERTLSRRYLTARGMPLTGSGLLVTCSKKLDSIRYVPYH